MLNNAIFSMKIFSVWGTTAIYDKGMLFMLMTLLFITLI